MPRRCKEINVRGGMRVVGGVSCLLLLLLMFMAVNPVVGSLAFAEGDEGGLTDLEYSGEVVDMGYDGADGEYDGEAGDFDGSDAGSYNIDAASDDNAGIMTLANTTTSTVGVAFSPASYYSSLSPTDTTGQSAKIDITATVSVYNSGGYSVYLKSNDARLVGTNTGNTIAGATTAKTYANMDVNTWGYASTVGAEVPVDATYKAVSVSGNGDEVAKNNSPSITADTKTIALSFATKINDQMPADTYSNTMILSVVSNPSEVVIAEDFGIGTMQDMNSSICANAKDNNGDGEITGQLKDVRDGKYYWISKLADNKCWMTQNLDLDLSTGTKLTSDTSDVSDDGWTPDYTTADIANEGTMLDDPAGTRSWDLGDYRIVSPDTVSDCGNGKNSAADCPDQFTTYNTPTTANNDERAHYILGNHYQWRAATANSNAITSGSDADYSICPRGWRLLTSGDVNDLTMAGNVGANVAILTNSPYYFVRGGVVSANGSLFYGAGYYGYYWSSTAAGSDTNNLDFAFSDTDKISIGYDSRQAGFSVRCVAR